MKKIITLLAVALTANLSISQTAFQSNMSNFFAGNPLDWTGSSFNISSANFVQVQTSLATYGTSFTRVISSTTSHKRFSTEPVSVAFGAKYLIEIWAAANLGSGDLRVNYYDTVSNSYGTYTPYQNVGNASNQVLVKLVDSITVSPSSSVVEFVFSLKSSDGSGILVDSVSITQISPGTGTPPPPFYSPKTIFQIQNTTSPSGDSPYEDSLVELTGVVTGVSTDTRTKGYFIQDSASAWNGIFINDGVGTPTRGDKVTVRGEVKENFDNTQIMSVDTMILVSSGNPEPAVVAVTSATAADEMYEGVLLKVSAAMCVDTVVRFGEWFIAGTGIDTLMIDNLLLSTTYNPVLYQGYDVTGVLFYSFSNFKIEPRDSTDIVQNLIVSINEANENLTISVYPNPTNGFLTLSGTDIGTAEIFTLEGKLVQTLSLNYINTLDVSALKKGVYLLKVTSANKTGVTRFVKQ